MDKVIPLFIPQQPQDSLQMVLGQNPENPLLEPVYKKRKCHSGAFSSGRGRTFHTIDLQVMSSNSDMWF